MTDYFLLLVQPRHPWLDLDALKTQYLALSAAAHPDHCAEGLPEAKAAANRSLSELNSAHSCLRDLKPRLLHLIQLESGSPPKDIQRIPPGTMDLFMEVGQTCRDAGAFAAQLEAAASSPMLKVRLLHRTLEWTDRLNALREKVAAAGHSYDAELQALNLVWDAAPPPGSPERPGRLPLERLELIYRALSYSARWTAQIQERAGQLVL